MNDWYKDYVDAIAQLRKTLEDAETTATEMGIHDQLAELFTNGTALIVDTENERTRDLFTAVKVFENWRRAVDSLFGLLEGDYDKWHG